jgi:hypothetical protein
VRGSMLTAIVDSGAIALVAMAIIAVEIGLVWRAGSPGRAAFAANGLAGMLILAALGLALAGYGTAAVAGALGASFCAHLVYLVALRRA